MTRSAEASALPARAPRARRPISGLLIAVLTPVFALLALVAWSLSSPVGSSPDEDFHLPSIWCSLGDRAGLCESVPGHPDERRVDRELTNSSACYAFKATSSGACSIPVGSTAATARGNFAQHLYPPLYYVATGLLASPHVGLSVLMIRVMNSLLFVGLTTLLYWLLPPKRRRTLIWSLAITIVPLGAFVIASVNPSAWTVVSAGLLWLALVGYHESVGGRRIGLGALAVVATLMGGGSRADGALYAIMAVAVSVILVGSFTKRFLVQAILPAALVVASAILYLTGSQAGALSSGLISNPGGGGGVVALLWTNLLDVLSLVAGAIGTWPLGWVDTTMPSSVWVPTIFVFSVVVFLALRTPGGRKIFAVSAVGAGLIVLPMWLLYTSHVFVGTQFQPRYLLPVLVIFAAVALFQDTRSVPLQFSRAQTIVIAGMISLANAVALHVEIRRYVSGVSYASPDLDHGVTWWWGIGVPPLFVWFAGAVFFSAAVYAALFAVNRKVPAGVLTSV